MLKKKNLLLLLVALGVAVAVAFGLHVLESSGSYTSPTGGYSTGY